MRSKYFIILAAGAVIAIAAFAAANVTAGDGASKHSCTSACSSDGCSTSAVTTISVKELTADELKLVNHLADLIEKNKRVVFDPAKFAEATGLSLDTIYEFDQARIHGGIIAVLNTRGFDTSGIQFDTGSGNCSEFGACSVDKNLMGASGAELEKYADEKNTDGKEFALWKAPDFTLPSTDGAEVSLSDYYGKPVAVVLFATHCNHCVDTVPILTGLRDKYASSGLVILPVVVNARSVKSVQQWAKSTGADFPILVATDKELSNAFDTRLVPATFLINEKGYVTKKFVTFQNKERLDGGFAELVKGSSASAKGSK